MTTFIFLFRILSQPYDALHQKIVSWTVIIQYVYLWSVFNGMPTTDLNGLIKECNVLTVGFFSLSFSRSPSKQQTTTESANKYISQALKARNLEKEKREQVNSFTLRFKSSFQEKQVHLICFIVFVVSLLSEDINF